MNRFSVNTLGFVGGANREGWTLISVSTGVNDDSLSQLEEIKRFGYVLHFVCIDVAHAHHIKVKNRIQWIKENLPNTKIIAGNIATYEAYKDLVEWGADVVKVGIGGGSICTTRFQTGFSVPMFSCVNDIKIIHNASFTGNKPKLAPIIADGGIKYSGDIAKALVAGATMVMTGKLFASCLDSPAQIVDNKKQYRGSTSFAAKKHNKHIEGRTIDLEADITVKERLQEIKEALSSSISYGGGNNLECFEKVKWLEV